MAPRFSLITCTWNSLPYLDDTIRSVLEQDFDDYEWIFVDGGSTDGTLERIAALPRPFRLLKNVRGGISHAMNAGLQVAQGRYVAHLHSDDFYVRPDVLRLVSEAFERTGRSWLFGRSMPMKNGILQNEDWVAPRYSRKALVRGNFIPHPATFVSLELFGKVGGFDEGLKYAMDYDLWLRLSALAEPATLTTPLAAMREHAGSASTANRLAAMEEDFRVRVRHARPRPFEWFMHRLRLWVRRRRALREGAI